MFNNPFDKLSTSTIIKIIWTFSMVLSIPFFVTVDIDYWDYHSLSVMCKSTKVFKNITNMTIMIDITNTTNIININTTENYNVGGDIPFFDLIMDNHGILSSTRLISMIVEFIIPTLVVGFFSGKIIIRLFDTYLTSAQRIRSNSNSSVNGCEITKRLIFILFIFIMKNTAFLLVTGRWSQVFYNVVSCPTSVSSGAVWFFFYEIYRITTTLNSFIYFWMSSDFREKCRMFLFKCISSRSTKKSVKEQTLKIVQVLE